MKKTVSFMELKELYYPDHAEFFKRIQGGACYRKARGKAKERRPAPLRSSPASRVFRCPPGTGFGVFYRKVESNRCEDSPQSRKVEEGKEVKDKNSARHRFSR
jgi:hypothetical protein